MAVLELHDGDHRVGLVAIEAQRELHDLEVRRSA